MSKVCQGCFPNQREAYMYFAPGIPLHSSKRHSDKTPGWFPTAAGLIG